MRIGIVGGREYKNETYVQEAITKFISSVSELNLIIEIVSGGAKGVDSIAEKYAKEQSLSITIFPPDTDKYGAAAFNIRNRQIAKYCDILLAFPNPKSVGTWNTIHFSYSAGKEVRIFPYKE